MNWAIATAYQMFSDFNRGRTSVLANIHLANVMARFPCASTNACSEAALWLAFRPLRPDCADWGAEEASNDTDRIEVHKLSSVVVQSYDFKNNTHDPAH
jgi:hypothetical protein